MSCLKTRSISFQMAKKYGATQFASYQNIGTILFPVWEKAKMWASNLI